MRTACLLLIPGACLLGACEPTREVSRVDPRAVVDVDYRFNDTDARQVYQGMVNDALYRTWIDRSVQALGHKPVVIVGPIRNDTQEYIDTKMFTTQFERELLNSDRVRFVAMADQRDAVRAEREQGQEWSRPETRKQMKQELGADYILIGRVADDKPRSLSGRSGVAYYQVTLEMVDLESNEKVWIGVQEIKKVWRDR
ncbi:MAG: penicillin-binding protein activator LpoB [Phycisphaeraceae bacterium]|nr:penicillin-binding protein activator LpoB [Phycisphaeraceae bacterium]